MTDELIVYRRHIRAADQCARGGRKWFAKHGLNWSDFLTNGIPASVLIETGCPIAAATVAEAVKEAEEAGDGQ